MSTLLLRLEGPLQSWGTESRFSRRSTDSIPSRSGVFGLLAAAKGMRRSDDLTELLTLKFGVRADQPGRIIRDYQTARPLDGGTAKLSERFYLADSRFLAAVQGSDSLIEDLGHAVRNPHHPLYLGRRSCPPTWPVFHGFTEQSIHDALADGSSWLLPEWARKKKPGKVRLEVAVDAPPSSKDADLVRDDPVSFDPAHRQYGFRRVKRYYVEIENAHSNRGLYHDPFAVLEG